MEKTEPRNANGQTWTLPSVNRHKAFLVSGQLFTVSNKNGETPSAEDRASQESSGVASADNLDQKGKLLGFPVTSNGKAPEKRSDLLHPPQLLTIDQLARSAVEGLDYASVMNQLADLGPDGRLLLYYQNGKLLRYEVFEDPRICKNIERGGVIHNLEQKPADMSGWRVHEFYIDSKGCLGEICSRCARVCPENAIHLRGEGASSFCEIDPTACKGCFICWVECSRKAADCILVDGKVYDSELRAAHFGE